MVAAGAGWLWIRHPKGAVHVTGSRGPRGPLTLVMTDVPRLRVGTPVALDLSHAVVITAPATPLIGDVADIRRATDAVRAHAWNDPRARAIGDRPIEELIGLGPGLTPACDDAICGYLATRRALDPASATAEAQAVLAALDRTGEPSRSLLAAAARDGWLFDAGAAMLAAVLAGDGPGLAPAVRRLADLGRTTGRALLTGIIRGCERGFEAVA